MNFLKSFGFGTGTGLGGLPYEIDTTREQIDFANYVSDFQLLCGKSRPENIPVSIFKSKLPATATTSNALKRMKTMRHPNILAYLGGVEISNGHVIIVTEEVVPLEYALAELRGRVGKGGEEESRFFTWGLRSIFTALNFINNDCKLIHGNVSPSNIYVTKGGDWKLGGFDLCSEMTSSGPSSFFTSYDHTVEMKYKSPERVKGDWRAMGTAPIWASDMWSLGCAYFCIQNGSFSSSEEAQRATIIPRSFQKLYQELLIQQPSRRINPAHALQSQYFDDDYVRTLVFIEELAIKEQKELVDFCRALPPVIDTFPRMCSLYKILPALKKHIELGGSGGQVHPSASHVLPLMLKIGTLMQPEEFKVEVLPTVVRLFGSNDRALRVQLLQTMEAFVEHLDENLINKTIFDHICSGFGDTAPILRELTVKSMLHISQKLNRKNLNERLMKHFAKMQVDPEPAIRTNTTICLGRVAPYLDEKTRDKILLPAFCRALRDPFPHARFAGLRALGACEQYINTPGLANSAMPVICPLLLDPTSFVRDEAFVSMDVFLKRLQTVSAEMKIEEQRVQQDEARKREEEISRKSSDLPSQATALAIPDSSAPPLKSHQLASVTINEIKADEEMGWGGEDDGWDDFSPVASDAQLKKFPSGLVQSAPSSTNDDDEFGWDQPVPLVGSSKLESKVSSMNIKQSNGDNFFSDWGEHSKTNAPIVGADSSQSASDSVESNGKKKSLSERRKEALERKQARRPISKAVKKELDSGWDDWDM